jgi:hypothetical protein
MMVGLLLCACARGNRSSRGVERAWVEDVARRVVTGDLVPDHSAIAEFRCRHERPPGEVFCGVLGPCARAGLATVGVVAIGGTRMAANASTEPTATSAGSRGILAEAAAIDEREDGLYGAERGGELPERRRTREGRRRALRGAKERLAREGDRASEGPPDSEQPVTVDLDPRHFVTRPQGVVGRGCAKGAARWTPSASARRARSRGTAAIGCFEAGRRLEEELGVERASHVTHDAWRARASLRTGRGGWRRGWSGRTSRRWCRAG